LMEDIDKLPHGPAWSVYEINTILPNQDVRVSYLFTRNIVDVALELVANPVFKDFMHYVPERLWTTEDCQSRVYDNPWTGDWWWRIQARIRDRYGTILPLIIASDRTRLSIMSGGQEAYPVYLTIGNIDKSILRKTSFKAMVLLAYLPVEDFEHSTGDEKARLKNQLTHRAMEVVTASLRKTSKEGVEAVCADGRYRRCYPIVAGVIGDWPEHCMMACVEEGACPKCEQLGPGRGDYPRRARARHDRDTLEALARYFKNQDLGELEELGLKPWWPWWANLPYVDFAASIMPDVLHQIHQGMVKTHIVKWVRILLGKRFVDQCYIAMPQAEGMRHFGKGISKLKGQWTGRKSREVAKQLLPIATGQRSKKCDPDLVGLTWTILEFSYRAHSSRMTSDDIRRLEEALAELHGYKNVIVREGVFEDNSRFDRIPKLHMLSHYSDSICEMGTPDNYSTEAPERLHIDCAKQGWRASNKVRPTPQMVIFMQRYEALQIHHTYMNEW
ncbi:hypothetical protein BDV93DRAFT_407138, partial [Ceratobasidium sp. AG-I]